MGKFKVCRQSAVGSRFSAHAASVRQKKRRSATFKDASCALRSTGGALDFWQTVSPMIDCYIALVKIKFNVSNLRLLCFIITSCYMFNHEKCRQSSQNIVFIATVLTCWIHFALPPQIIAHIAAVFTLYRQDNPSNCFVPSLRRNKLQKPDDW